MGKEKLALCIGDPKYQERFVKCLMNHYKEQYEINAFSEMGEITENISGRYFSIILGGKCQKDDIINLAKHSKTIVYLEDMDSTVSAEMFCEEPLELLDKICFLNKYQEVYGIMDTIEVRTDSQMHGSIDLQNMLTDKLSEKIRVQILARSDFSKELEDEKIQELIAEEIEQTREAKELPLQEKSLLEQRIFNTLRKLDVLQELIEDEAVTEIMVNGPNQIFYEKDGEIFEYPYGFSSEEKLQDVIQQIVGKHNRVVNLSSPIVDTRLEDGSRANIVLSPISIDGSAISIRKFSKTPLDMDSLIENGTISQEVADFLKKMVVSRYNLFISGGTSSGKTTFLNALSAFIPQEERIITIEDAAELQLQGNKNLVRLETRNCNTDGVIPIRARELIHTALRMRPDRIIVGECRGEEALDMLQAMNTGHDGSLSTGHGNSTKDMLNRLETMVLMGMELPLLAIRQQIASGIDVLVHLERGKDKKRRVVEVSEVLGVRSGEIQLNTLYMFDGKDWIKRGGLKNTTKLELTIGEENEL